MNQDFLDCGLQRCNEFKPHWIVYLKAAILIIWKLYFKLLIEKSMNGRKKIVLTFLAKEYSFTVLSYPDSLTKSLFSSLSVRKKEWIPRWNLWTGLILSYDSENSKNCSGQLYLSYDRALSHHYRGLKIIFFNGYLF